MMLDVLNEVEKDLPKLLMADGWGSVYIDSHPPVVEQMWRMWDKDPNVRICLNWIHACDRTASRYHRHKWPSAAKLLTGACWMRVGSSWHFENEDQPGAVASDILLRAPSVYEMAEQAGWHSISPIIEDKSSEMTTYRHSSGGSLSLMVNGPPWSSGGTKPLYPLSASQQKNLLDRFRYWYPHRFIDYIRRNGAFPSAIDNFISRWHDGGTGVAKLHDFLGFTKKEYAQWVEKDNLLMKMITEKKIEFEERLGTFEGFPME